MPRLHNAMASIGFAVAIISMMATATHAQSGGVQMMPPLEFDQKTVCSGASAGMLFWDGDDPITCIPGFVGTANGSVGIGTSQPQSKLDVNGGIHPGPATTGTSCSGNAEGTFAYDAAAHAPVYCSNTGNWTAIGSVPSGTLCGWLWYDYVQSPYTWYVVGTPCSGGSPALPYYTNNLKDYNCPPGYSLVNITTDAATVLGANYSCVKS